LFEPLGVDEATLAVYRALLTRPDSTPEQLSTTLGLPLDEILRRMDRLRELELLVPTWAIAGAEHAVHPRIGLNGLAQRRRNELNQELAEVEQAVSSAEVLAEQYNELLVSRTSADVEVLEGRTRASRRVEELTLKARETCWALIPAHVDDIVSPPEEAPERPMLERGVKMRYVYLQSLTISKAGRELCEWVHRMGGEIRATPTLPLRLILIDSEIAIMPLDPETNEAGAVVHRSPSVVALSLALFDSYWSKAVEVFAAEDRDNEAPLTAHEAEVLRLLAGGAKDEQVARLLGISLRTARRITANLAERADATSRFELGVAAAKRGWV
jgi:DNA-binding CsgD family transcriptional regulator